MPARLHPVFPVHLDRREGGAQHALEILAGEFDAMVWIRRPVRCGGDARRRDDEHPAWSENARRLPDDRLRAVDVLNRLEAADGVERVLVERQIRCVHDPELEVWRPVMGAGVLDCLLADVPTDGRPRDDRKTEGAVARAAADVEDLAVAAPPLREHIPGKMKREDAWGGRLGADAFGEAHGATILARALPALRRRPLELAIPALAAATVFAFACGSSSVAGITRVGHGARWVALAILLVAAVARVVATRRLVVPIAPAVAAAAFVALALTSAGWSISPRLSAERAVSLGVLFVTAIALAAAEREPRRLVAGLVIGSAAVALAGLVVLAVDHSAAVQAASIESPARFRGFGQDANTAALLFGIAIAPALALAYRNRAWLAAVALLAGSIVASGSRGGLFAGGVGALVVVVVASRALRPAAVAAAAVVVATVLGLVVQNVPKAQAHSSGPVTQVATSPAPRVGYLNAEAVYPLNADVGAPLPGGGQPPITRGFFGGSGRLDAWIGAGHQIMQRPILGFGFGTEGDVFVDRYYYFVGGSPEDSYLGISLQLGFVGLVALLTLVTTIAWPLRRALRNDVAAACAGALAASLVLAIVQSYVYSVGDIGTTTLWISAFLLPVVTRGR